MDTILKGKLPKHATLSPDIRERALGYIVIQSHGLKYYVPITKELKTLFKISKRGNKFIFRSYKEEKRIEHFLRDFIIIMYLQVREEVGDGIHQSLSQELGQGFEELFSKYLSNRIESGFDKKQIGFDKKE